VRNKLYMLMVSAYFVMAAPTCAAEMTAPDALAKSVTDEVLVILRADKEIQAGNQKKVYELIETKIAPHFNFTTMTRLAMGKNWSQANPEQRKALTSEFRVLLVRTYTTAFTQYSNQTIEYRPAKLAPNDDDVMVKSFIRQPSGQPVSVDYSMEKTAQGWKVYNVKIEGISLVENYRNTFNTEVQKSGIDGLVKALVEKNRALVRQAQTTGK
jgi:phospholipid transport system substrate-binding protein